MKPRTVARLVGGAIILFNLWLIGQYRIEGVMVLVLTFGVAIAFELLIVRSLADGEHPRADAAASARPQSEAAPPRASSHAAPAEAAPSHAAPLVAEGSAEALLKSLVLSEDHWKRALEEFEGNARRSGLWGKSFAEADGNEAVAKAKYLQVRASELAQADWVVAQEAARAAEAARLSAEEAARLALQREYDAKPKGICPSCKQVILLNADECPKCHATFGVDAAWHVLPLRGET